MSTLANCFSFIGGLLLIFSTFATSKRNVLGIQVANSLFCAIGCFLIGSYSAVSTNLVATIRNSINALEKNNKYINTILISC